MTIPLDAHAHIEPDIALQELVALHSCVIAVTRTLAEYQSTRRRNDPSVVWGAGCHPGLAREVRRFSVSGMREAIATTPVIGEVGLDRSARTPIELQLAALRGVLKLVADTPRILSLHSYRATDLILRELHEYRPAGAILHWWLGTPAETKAAVEAGAYFSVNASQARKWENLHLVPSDRIPMETVHPFGDRSEAQPRRPGHVTKPEHAVSAALGLSPEALRVQTWRNLRTLADELSLAEMFPHEFQVQFLAV